MTKAVKEKKPKAGKVIAKLELPRDVTSILALDLSLNSSGYAFCNLDTDEVEMGVIAPPKMSEMARLDYILNAVKDLADKHDLMNGQLLAVIEGFAFGAKNQAHQLGMLHGVIRHFLWSAKIDFLLIAPLSNKKWVTGKSMAEKSLILKEIFKRYGFDTDDDNVADALGLMTLTKAVLGKWDKPLVAFQQEVVSKVLEATA